MNTISKEGLEKIEQELLQKHTVLKYSYFKPLYDKGLIDFNRIVNGHGFQPISFDVWYNKLFGDISETIKYKFIDGTVGEVKRIDTKRLVKIIQQGNFGIPQPTGGFDININEQKLRDQYKKAIKNEQPVLMVITEPFDQTFGDTFLDTQIDKTQYRLIKIGNNACGIYSNEAFNSLYVIEPIDNILPSDVAKGRVVSFKITKDGTEVTRISNFHGNSSGLGNEDNLIHNIEWGKRNGITYITGDSNITMSKPNNKSEKEGKHIHTFLQGLLSRGLQFTFECSRFLIQKSRTEMDILLNNQITKGKGTPEVDGMFIVKLANEKNTSSGGASSQSPILDAFKEEYDKTRTPILSDHSVVEMVDKDFILLSATGASIDDKNNGIFPKDEWQAFDSVEKISEFHDTIGKPYTLAWVNTYNQWVNKNRPNLVNMEFPVQYFNVTTKKFQDNPPALPTSGGSRRKSKPKRKKTRKMKSTRRKRKQVRFHRSKKS